MHRLANALSPCAHLHSCRRVLTPSAAAKSSSFSFAWAVGACLSCIKAETQGNRSQSTLLLPSGIQKRDHARPYRSEKVLRVRGSEAEKSWSSRRPRCIAQSCAKVSFYRLGLAFHAAQVALELQIDEANRSRVALERLLTEVRAEPLSWHVGGPAGFRLPGEVARRS